MATEIEPVEPGYHAEIARRRHGGGDPWQPLPVLEDKVFVEKLERAGRTRHLPTWAETSARRFLGREWTAIGTWKVLRTLHALRVPATALAKIYREIRD